MRGLGQTRPLAVYTPWFYASCMAGRFRPLAGWHSHPRPGTGASQDCLVPRAWEWAPGLARGEKCYLERRELKAPGSPGRPSTAWPRRPNEGAILSKHVASPESWSWMPHGRWDKVGTGHQKEGTGEEVAPAEGRQSLMSLMTKLPEMYRGPKA